MGKRYECKRAISPPRLDGVVSGEAWDSAPFTEKFENIVSSGETPYFSTRCKMLYDETYFYFGAVLEEPHVWGTIMENQSVIFHDNDIELFLDPNGDGLNYYEFEINALGTWWQLTLDRPYSQGGSARNVDLKGLISSVHVDGKVNDPTSFPDRGWSMTVALPLCELEEFGAGKIVPGVTVWRANFSRVQWKHRVTEQNTYERIPPHGVALPQGSNFDHPEENWTWCMQKEINMHDPNTWGFIAFI